MRYRKKPVVVDAVQWTGENLAEIRGFVVGGGGRLQVSIAYGLSIWNEPEQQWISAPHGHWIIKGVAGEFYPCEPGIFAATYEPAGDES